MTDIIETLSAAAGEEFAKLGLDPALGALAPCSDPSRGDLQCIGALQAAKAARRPPLEIAKAVAEGLSGREGVESCEVAGPGYVNVRVDGAWLAEAAASAAVARSPSAGKAVLDYGGPNIAKAMHVGHLRSSVIGESLKRILLARGWDVRGDVHLGDWGLPMGQVAAELRLERPDLPHFSGGDGPFADPGVTIEDLERLYPQASARSKSDPAFLEEARALTAAIQDGSPGPRALWERFSEVSIERLRDDFAGIGVTFDDWLGESSVADAVPALCASLLASGVAEPDDGALVVRVAQEGENKPMPPFLLLKSDGSSLYSTTDLATLDKRTADGAGLVAYVVDARQGQHFEALFRAARKSGLDRGAKLVHAGFGTVNGKDGKPFKTRDGGVMRLGDLVAMATDKARERLAEGGMAEGLGPVELDETARRVGLAAVKFADLSNSPKTSYQFDLDRMVSFEGRTGPYVQYMAVRLRSVLAKAAAAGIGEGSLSAPTNQAERELMGALVRFPDAVADAERALEPTPVASWAFATAQAVGRFYGASPVLRGAEPEVAAARLALARRAADMLSEGLALLGVEVPERM